MFVYLIKLILLKLWIIISSVIVFVIAIFRPFSPKNGYLYRQILVPLAQKIIGLEVEIRNQYRIYTEPQAIFVCNHQSNLDLFVFGTVVSSETVAIAKKQVMWVPLIGQVYWLSGNIFLDRKNPKSAHQRMDEVEQQLRRKRLSLWVFPEGTRSKDGKLRDFKKGAFRVAINTQLPIIPVVASSYRADLKLTRVTSAKIIVDVLNPIETKGKTLEDLDEVVRNVQTQMRERIEELNKEKI
ncbi:1-acylglycerol-3-phosphate O-acyltransferase [Deltaproteobacteria bacterium TL4]